MCTQFKISSERKGEREEDRRKNDFQIASLNPELTVDHANIFCRQVPWDTMLYLCQWNFFNYVLATTFQRNLRKCFHMEKRG